jgi:hypothetical protein
MLLVTKSTGIRVGIDGHPDITSQSRKMSSRKISSHKPDSIVFDLSHGKWGLREARPRLVLSVKRRALFGQFKPVAYFPNIPPALPQQGSERHFPGAADLRFQKLQLLELRR